jgi:hypothetical protein
MKDVKITKNQDHVLVTNKDDSEFNLESSFIVAEWEKEDET